MSSTDIHSWSEVVTNLLESKDIKPLMRFIDTKWHLTLYISLVYVIVIFSIKQYMQDRQKFSLRLPLALWSGSLAIFSAIGTLKTWPYLLRTLNDTGLVSTYCRDDYIIDNNVAFWYTMFVFSKPLELIDTLFIVLRKQPLIQLHWVHHILTMVYCFFVYRDGVATATWMVCMNFAVHTVMYGYYALKAMQIHVPRKIAFVITISQIVQMIWGLVFNFHVFFIKIGLVNGPECACSMRASLAGVALYSLFFYYFVEFFIGAYFRKPRTNKNGIIAKHDLNNNATPNGKIKAN